MPERGEYQTKQQEAVEALFRDRADVCLTAEDAYDALMSDGTDVGKTTVYRAITKLCARGVLRRYAPHERGGAASYQHNPCAHSHMHIRCTVCGALSHLHCEEVEAFAAHLKGHHGFTLDEGQTILYGLCDDCRQRSEEDEGK